MEHVGYDWPTWATNTRTRWMLDVNFGDINARAAARLGSRTKQVGMWRRLLNKNAYNKVYMYGNLLVVLVVHEVESTFVSLKAWIESIFDFIWVLIVYFCLGHPAISHVVLHGLMTMTARCFQPILAYPTHVHPKCQIVVVINSPS